MTYYGPTRNDPCPSPACAGRIRVPIPVPVDREVVASCDGLFTHTFGYRTLEAPPCTDAA